MPMASKKEMTEFGKKLDALLQSKKMSDTQLAEKLKIRQPNVYAMKYLTELPQQRTIKKLANLFKVDISYFYPNPEFTTQMSLDKGVKVFVVVEKNGKVIRKTRVV